jgi:spore germination protein YaaH
MVTRAIRLEGALATAAAWGLLALAAASLELGQESLPSEHKSIHQIEMEAHRNVATRSVRTARRMQALPQLVPPNRTRTVFGFYPYWAPGYAQLRFQDLTHLAVFAVEAAGSGQLVNLRGWPNAPLIHAAHDANVRVILVCTLFDSSQLDSLLSSPNAQQALIADLKGQVLDGGADGINIDFEGVPGRHKVNLVQFMKNLALELRAAIPGAHVSIDTPAVDWSNAFDYAALADICDALMIMGYDYYWSGSSYAGPVSPLAPSSLWGAYCVQWTVMDYLAKVGPDRSDKLVLGVPYYGYDWPVTADVLHARTSGKATARIYSVASAEAASYGRRWDSLASVPWYAYFLQTMRQTWYEDAESLAHKYDLVLQNGLQGIGIWALTYDRETSELWDLIENYFAPPPLPDPPEITAPQTFFDTTGLPIALRAQGDTPAASFEVAVGTSPGTIDISGFQSVGLRNQVFLHGLSFAPAATYYVTARSRGQQGLAGLAGPSAAITIDVSRPVQHGYLPRWVSGHDFYTGLALLNADSAAQAFLIRGYLEGQADAVVTSWVLKPGQQLAELVSEDDVLGSACFGKSGWLEVSCQGDALHSMYMVGDTHVSRSLDGGPLLDSTSRCILPQMDGGRAVIEIANPSGAAASLHLQLQASDGPYSLALSIPPENSWSARVADLFPSAFAGGAMVGMEQTDPFQASFLVVESDQAVVCSSTLQRDHDSAVIPGVPLVKMQKDASFSYIVQGGGYETEIVLVNPSPEALEMELRLSGEAASSPVQIQLPPASGRIYALREVFNVVGDAMVRGVLNIHVLSGPGVIGSAWVHSTDYRVMTALPLETCNTTFLFPHIAQAQGYWTGLSITNAGDTVNRTTVEALDADGQSLGQFTVDLAPGEQRVALVYQWIPSTFGMTEGRLAIRSSGPLLAAEIFGNTDLSFIAVVPGK